ncbi:MerR family transcriptional regulator [Actinoplanes subtropicus]|uniref:MerR family transcriptional regulator n=1 Tax=Actinoplanes subtropicus TaxID=543632 RepID=UPI0004C31C21|nr:MerR family transcriptional regulator [Actinoplanes subtropicus]
MIEPPLLRIGELSRRLGVSEHVLRAWERRYGLLQPVRSAGGFRLYSEADLQRIRRMQALLSDGLSAAEAARAAINEEASAPAVLVGLAAEATTLARALDGYDEPAAQAALDRLFGTLTVESVLRDVLLPYLHELGERWRSGAASVAQEHFASNVIRGRLAGLGRGWGHGQGPRAVLACAPDEQHDIPLLAFGVVLNRHGWRIDYLGANTPIDDLVRLAGTTHPDLVVVSATQPQRLAPLTAQLTRLAGTAPLALAGPGATTELADTVGARLLTGDPVTAAQNVKAR